MSLQMSPISSSRTPEDWGLDQNRDLPPDASEAQAEKLKIVVQNPALRSDLSRIKEHAHLIFTSPLILTFGSIFASSYFLPFKAVAFLLAAIAGGMVIFSEKVPKALFYEAVMVDNWGRNAFTHLGVINSPYYSEIEPGRYIGALPLKNLSHDQIIKQLGVKAVLAVIEDYEFEKKTFMSEAVQKSDWQQEGIELLHIPSGDLNTISMENLHKAADFIHAHPTCYNHCKAGRGRSAMCYIAKLIKYNHKSYEEAFAFVKAKRPQINLKTRQIQCMKNFEAEVR